jgi:hypothetical protein
MIVHVDTHRASGFWLSKPAFLLFQRQIYKHLEKTRKSVKQKFDAQFEGCSEQDVFTSNH